ncbi:ATP-dependent helicase HrpB [Mesorhizobium sp. M2D.F.Ca.ET.185.01.1.1]|uniref:ATP-dependent helicase HrpB n=2 Tax=Mesorhizobium TaxID=68287 RepID=UPI000FCCAE58|nr:MULTISPECIES: ATP-dependent helicase HrpB [unclassified Mesorhizobium]TGP78225.1 ATP-dependent helicase HrpB [bacterium M00.F.Ca.ET.227.01.1.1]TGP88347.1 ATP-dependent helicase HrpB [bacterium M00.F.Ca.ET.221.01.1.1]TGP93559.1 ATP-dependent helicase HrpB [bacterium M00.F.Ca.ET.222.01.1.1]TGT72418.1 ATP-dependent helicase HrpB [bacterium M00.F.Ca.ET.159.01.1.1]TGT85587.1 ATP-dependent helicase HrpB [bacterium M00.F.Ca.ET.157.01.1.1]TGU12868.1 ATP-dependent helicase HrpB [bacterium M00.F.Ca.
MTTKSLPELPVTAALPALGEALAQRSSAVLVAPPGAGKTTLVPLALLDAPWLGQGRIVLLEPRRLAARAAARRMAELLGEEPGGTVGYAMRMENRTSTRTKILVVTEGVLSRMILDDPDLPGVSAVIFDEFHERSLDGDFGLALALDVQGGLRPDLRVLVMSATLDGARVAKLLAEAPVIESEGRAFPIEIRYDERPGGVAIEDAMARAVRSALGTEQGSVLAFLPGQREIERTAERLAGNVAADTDIVRLYGQLDNKAQDAAIKPAPAGRRKVVLATSIAETSITIDGVRVVIDSGLSRLPRYEPASGLTRLETVRVSKASADQRAGRAGRTQAGVAVRLWRAEQTASLAAFTPPEILEADLSGLLLDCAAFGVADPSSLSFLDPPPAPALNEARVLLRALHAIDDAGRLTEVGAAMRKLALPVRLAHMVAEAAKTGHAREAATLAVLLTERGLGGDSADLERRLMRFDSERSPRANAARQLAERLAKPSPSRGGSASALSDAQSDRRGGVVDGVPEPTPPRSAARLDPPLKGEGKGAGSLLIHAWPDRVARARGERGRFVLANGSGAMVDAVDPLANETWLVVADLQGKAQNARITAAASVDETDIRSALADRIETKRETSFDRERRAVRVREIARLGAITLSERMLPAPSGADADRAITDAVREHGLSLLDWGKEAETLRQRLGWLHRGLGAPWPDVSDEALLDRLDDWLLPSLAGDPSLAAIKPATLSSALMALVPHDLQRKVDALAPTHFDAPSGSHVPIRYDGEWPVLAIRVQELFGLDRHPAIANGTVPLTLELLSPAHRPIQTTRDLPGFWRGSWADVRTDMRGRYPKHVWPENPLLAAATSRAKPRGT